MGFVKSLGAGLTTQNGFNAKTPDINKQNFNPAIATGQGQFNTNINNEGTLAAKLGQQANGQGPNVAQNQFQQNVNQNMQQGAGMVSSQKGINPALAARMAAQGVGAANQNASANEATLQGQQELGDQSAEGNIYNSMGGQENQNNSILQTANANQNNAITTGQDSANAINAGVAQQNATNENATTQGLFNAAAGGAEMWATGGASAAPKYKGGLITEHHGGVIDSVSHGLATGAGLAMALMKLGGDVPGHATVKGNSIKNDTVPTLLSPGEIVLPRSVTQSPEAAKKAQAFVEHLRDSVQPKGYAKVLAAKQKKSRK